MTFTLLTSDQFDQHSQAVGQRHFVQSTQMGKLLSARGYEVAYLGLVREGVVKVSAMVYSSSVRGGKTLTLYYGPLYEDLADLPQFLTGLKAYAKKNRVIELLLTPYTIYQYFDDQGQAISEPLTDLVKTYEAAGFAFSGLSQGLETSDWHYVKDLTPFDTPAALLKSFNKNSQRLIKQAQNLGVVVRRAQQADLPVISQMLIETGQRQGFVVKDLDYLEKFYQAFGNQAEFLLAELDVEAGLAQTRRALEQLTQTKKPKPEQVAKLTKQLDLLESYAAQAGQSSRIPLATTLVTYFSQEAVYFMGGFSAAYQKLSAPFSLQYHAMCHALERGISHYNFLGIDGRFDGTDGILRFKQNFNGSIERRPGTFIYHPRPLTYALIKLLKQLVGS